MPATLALTLGAPASFGTFVPGVSNDYTAGTTATVTSTGATRRSACSTRAPPPPGRLINGSFALADQLQANANNGAFAPLRTDNGPLTLLTWNTPISATSVALGFKQHISASEGLRTGAYSKTLTFTLSTTAP